MLSLRTARQIVARIVSTALLLLSIIVLLMNYADCEWGPLRRFIHLPVYFAAGLLCLAVWHWKCRQLRMAALTAALGIIFAAQPARLWLPPSPAAKPTHASAPISVLCFNVFRDNRRLGDSLAALEQTNADVVFLTEMAPECRTALAPFCDRFPNALGNGENLLLSRFPVRDARRVPVSFDAARSASESRGGARLPVNDDIRRHWWNSEVLAATVQTPNGDIRVVCVHAPTPASDLSITIQRASALIAADELSSDEKAVAKLLVGDLNTSAFSPTFRFILRETKLRDSAQGFGYHPTWGPRLPREPVLPWIGLPIDHLLASDNVQIIGREIGPPTGSDHRWLMVRLAW